MNPAEFPTPAEIRQWISETVRHAWHIEYYLQELQVGVADIQRPHDIVGIGNKFEWPCIRGFAMQYRGYKLANKADRDAHFEKYTLPALKFHRQQDHHKSWNQYYPNASVDAMQLGAVDACCSLIEPRDYQGGCHTFDEVEAVAMKNPIHKVAWMLLMSREMERIAKPHIEKITLLKLPGKGISPESRDIITGRVEETIKMLKQDHGIQLPEG
jgi:hypothetical protein